jgi:predicted FMN-binding regulatory protein PaiB
MARLVFLRRLCGISGHVNFAISNLCLEGMKCHGCRSIFDVARAYVEACWYPHKHHGGWDTRSKAAPPCHGLLKDARHSLRFMGGIIEQLTRQLDRPRRERPSPEGRRSVYRRRLLRTPYRPDVRVEPCLPCHQSRLPSCSR